MGELNDFRQNILKKIARLSVKVGDLVKKISGRMDNGVFGIIIDIEEPLSEAFRRKVKVHTEKGIRKWFINAIEVISESR